MENDGVDGQGIFLALARRWKWVVAGAIAGLLVASLLVAFLPKRYIATVDLLVYNSPTENLDLTSRADTAAQLVHSIPVATSALQALGSPLDADDFLKEYRVSRLTNQLLRLEAWSSSPEEAAHRASAIARAYLGYVVADQDRTLATLQRAVDARVADLETTIAGLDGRISDLGAQPGELSAEQSVLLTSLLGQRETFAGELAANKARLEQAQTDYQQYLEKNKLVAEPLVPKDPTSPRLRQFMVIGFLLSTVLVAGAVIVRDVLSRRLFRREELACAAGVSVMASPRLGVRRRVTGRARTKRLAELVANPSRDLSSVCEAVASELQSLLGATRPTIVVASMAGEPEALAITLRLAIDLLDKVPSTATRRVGRVVRQSQHSRGPAAATGTGHDIVIVDGTFADRPVVGRMLGEVGVSSASDAELSSTRAFRVCRTADQEAAWEALATESGTGAPDPLAADGSAVRLLFVGEWRAAVGRARLAPDQLGASIIVTRPGRVTANNVQECTAALRQAGAPPVGIVVVDPDRFDTSTGQLPAPPPGEPPPPAQAVEPLDVERSALRGV